MTLMSVNFQNELSLVNEGVWFVPSASLGQRTKRSGFISEPGLSVLWICAGKWDAITLQRMTQSLLEKYLTFGCFTLVQRGCMHPPVCCCCSFTLRSPHGCDRYAGVLHSAEDPGFSSLMYTHLGCCWNADSAFLISSLVMPMLLLINLFIIGIKCSTGEKIWLDSEGPGSSPNCIISYLSKPQRNCLAALRLSFSFCRVIRK